MRVLVTGAAGFAGSGLVRRLLAAGHEVTGLDLIAPEEAKVGRLGPEPFAHPKFRYEWSYFEEAPLESDYDVFVHLAAQGDVDLGYTSPRKTVLTNVTGTVSLLEAARQIGVEHFIYASSAHAMEQSSHGPTSNPLTEDAELFPSTPYGFSKAAGEMACWTWHRCYGLPVTVMSNGVVAGPGMRREHFLWKWLTAIYRNEPVILEDGAQTRDLTYVDDVLDAWMLAIEAPREKVVGEKFQVSFGREIAVKDLLEMCFEITHHRVPIIQRPARPGETGMRECFDISKAQRVLGYRPGYGPGTTIGLTWAYVQRELAKGGAVEVDEARRSRVSAIPVVTDVKVETGRVTRSGSAQVIGPPRPGNLPRK